MEKSIFIDEIDIHSMSKTETQHALAEISDMEAKMKQHLQELESAQKYNVERIGDYGFFNVVKDGAALGYARVISMNENGAVEIELSDPVENLPADDKLYIKNKVKALVAGT